MERFVSRLSFAEKNPALKSASSKKCPSGHLMKFSRTPTQRRANGSIGLGSNVRCDQCGKPSIEVSEEGAFHCGFISCDFDLCMKCGYQI